MKDKRGFSIVNEFQKILGSSNRKPNIIWVDQDGEFYNYFFKRFMKNNKIKMYSTYSQEKSVVAERFIRTLEKQDF